MFNLRRLILLAIFAAVFWAFAFTQKYGPDFFNQIDYLETAQAADSAILPSLLGNWVVLDLVAWALPALRTVDADTALRALYFGVFLVKYCLILHLTRYTRYVIVLFLWSFSSQDINQLRLNIALVLFALLFVAARSLVGRLGKAVSVLAMLAAHISAVFVLPLAAVSWLRGRLRPAHVAAIFVIAGLVAAVALSGDFALDARFADVYLEASDRWIPKSLLAVPFMLAMVALPPRDDFDGLTRLVLVVLALLPAGLAVAGLQLVSQRFIEMAYSALLIKLAVENHPMRFGKAHLLFVPAVAIFAWRAVVGVLPG